MWHRAPTHTKSRRTPESITYLPFEAFMNCPKLSSVTMSDALSNIGASAFARCPSLKSITIPKGVKEIESEAFLGSGLEKATIQASNFYLRNSAFADCTSLTNVAGLEAAKWIDSYALKNSGLEGDIVFGNYLQNIGTEAFGGTHIGQVTLPASLTSCANTAFDGCDRLYAIDVAADNTQYYSTDGMLFGKGDRTLYICPDMQRIGSTIGKREEVVIPEGTLALGYQALGASVRHVTLPSSLVGVDYGLTGCQNLKTLTNLATNPQTATDNWTFPTHISNSGTLIVPKGCVDIYRNAEGWRKFRNIYETGNVPTDIGQLQTGNEESDKYSKHHDIYDLQGRHIASDTARLPKGIYIVGGKKIMK